LKDSIKKSMKNSRRWIDRQYNGQNKTKPAKRQTMIYKILLRKLKIELHKPHKKTGVKFTNVGKM
jgi:hypothetical protein